MIAELRKFEYTHSAEKARNKDVKRLPVNRLSVLKPVTGFKNVLPVIEFL